MRKVLFAPLTLAAATSFALAATPAFADEGRAEIRSGVVWGNGQTNATVGGALGYDADLGSGAFVGGEVSADKQLDNGYKVAFGFNGRIGAKMGEGTKLYGVGGYTTENCSGCNGTWDAGAGVEQKLGGKLYGKVEYRHFFKNDVGVKGNGVAAGIGVHF